MRYVTYLLLFANLAVAGWFGARQYLGNGTDGARRPEPPQATESRDGVDRLVMLSEVPAPASDRAAAAVAATDAAAEEPSPGTGGDQGQQQALPPPSSPLCLELQGFATRREAEYVRQRLARIEGVQAQLHERSLQHLAGYRVQLGPYRGGVRAREVYEEIRARGIRDVAVREDSGVYFVSLGFFSQEETRRQRMAQFTRLGYHPRVQEVFRRDSDYRVRLRVRNGDETVIRERLATLGGAAAPLQVSPRACEP